MRQILILWHILFLVLVATPGRLHAQTSQNCGLGDTLLIPPNVTERIYNIEITDVVNNDLSDPNQGICGIEITFRHNLSDRLEMWLTSPSGQRIQLFGPNVSTSFAFSFGAQWDISFVPCAEPAVPDSGFVAKWNNNQPNNFISGGRYDGSYYPFVGCLEDFNTGPINGTWQLTITNNPSVYAGAITDFRLRLCDERGFLCCDANPGSLAAYPDVEACAGSDALNLNLQPDYTNLTQPDTSEYGYTYMISQDGILLKYDSLTDLRNLPVGNYQICGLSYRKSDFSSFPQPNGVLRLDEFRRQLNGDSLLLCGRINNNCVDVRITSGSPPTQLNQTICQGDSISIGGQSFNTAGDYTVTLPGAGGCDSIINLRLTIAPAIVTDLDQTICPGDSVVVGTSVYKIAGTYSDTLSSISGCDSIVNLNLQVNNIPPTFLTAVICSGETYSAGGQSFDATGQYDVVLSSATGCDSLISLTLLVLNPSVSIAPPGQISCTQPRVTLNGIASGPSGQVDFVWTNLMGDTLGTDSTLQVDAAGFYILNVVQTAADFSCSVSDTLEVTSTAEVPTADAGGNFEINCDNPIVTIGGANTSVGPNISYRWRIRNGNIVGDTTQATATVDASGEYLLIVTNTASGCSDTASTIVTANFTTPFAEIDAIDTLSCEQTAVTLDIGNSTRGATIAYTWRDSSGQVIGAAPQQNITTPGTYFLEVRDTLNGCTALDSIDITGGIGVPAVTFDDTLIPCGIDTFSLQASITPATGNYSFFWTGPGVIGGGNSLTTPINQAGTYVLTVVNLDNGCIINEFVTVTQESDCDRLCVEGNLPDTLTCLQDTVAVVASFCEPCNNCTIEWTTADGNIVSNSDSLSILVNQPGTYTVTVRNSAGDSTSISLEVIQKVSFPTADAGADTSLTCAQPSLTLTGLGSPNARYSWTTQGGNIVMGGNTLNPTIDAPGIYVFNVLDTLTNCLVVDTVRISASEDRPQVPTFGDEMLTCLNPTITLDGSSFVGAELTGRWCQLDANNQEINCLDNPLLFANMAGTYRFTITNNNTGCQNSTTVQVVNNQLIPMVELGENDTLDCVQPSLQFNPTVTPGTGDYQYRWTTVNGSPIANDTILNQTITMPDIYILEVTNMGNGCVARDSVEILQNADVPSVFAGFDTELTCTTTSVQLEGTVLGNNLVYEWQTSTGNIRSGANTLTPVVDQPGTYFLRVTNQLSNCVAEDTLVVGQSILEPSAAVSNSDELNLDCISNSVTLDGCVSLSQTGATLRYRWQALNGTTITNPDSCTISVSRSGNYQLLVEDLRNGCRDSVTVTVNANPDVPAVTIPNPQPITCSRDTATLAAQVANGAANVGISWIQPNGQVLSDSSLNINVTTPGLYTFVIVNRANGCSDSTSVNVQADTLRPGITITPPNSLDCQIETVQIIVTTTGGSRFAYNWTTNDGSIVSGADASTVIVNAGGDYTIVVTNLDNGCTNQAVTGVKQGESSIQQAFFTVTPANCLRQGSGFVQIDSIRGGTGPFQYSLGEFPFAPEDFFQNLRAGEYALRVQDINGCEWETQLVVEAPEPITVELGNDTLISFGDTIRLDALFDAARVDSIAWLANGDSISFANTPSVVVAPPLSSIYWVKVTASNGCTATDFINIAVNQELAVFTPNVFTPNGDGVNDVFMIYAGENIKQVKAFMIFDRWGNRLLHDGPFQPNDPAHGWDGTFRGKLMDAGVYVFYAEIEIIDGRTQIIEGDITLLR